MADLYMYDAAFETKHLPLMKRKKAIAVSHYVSGSFEFTSPQPEATRALGMGSLQNWERSAGAMVGASRSDGRGFGAEFMAHVNKKIPQNKSVAAYFSVDVDVLSGKMNSTDDCLRGINDEIGKYFSLRIYGEIELIEHVCIADLVDGPCWLSMSEGFSPRGKYNVQSPFVSVVQMHGSDGSWIGTDIPATDRNTVTQPYELGAWWPQGSKYATAQPPVKGVTLVSAEYDKLRAQIHAMRVRNENIYNDLRNSQVAIVHGKSTDQPPHPFSQDQMGPVLVNSANGVQHLADEVQDLKEQLATALTQLSAISTTVGATPPPA